MSTAPVPPTTSEVDRRRERAALALSAKGDAQAVLRLVAAWAQVGTPTPAARVAEGRALLSLRLVHSKHRQNLSLYFWVAYAD